MASIIGSRPSRLTRRLRLGQPEQLHQLLGTGCEPAFRPPVSPMMEASEWLIQPTSLEALLPPPTTRLPGVLRTIEHKPAAVSVSLSGRFCCCSQVSSPDCGTAQTRNQLPAEPFLTGLVLAVSPPIQGARISRS